MKKLSVTFSIMLFSVYMYGQHKPTERELFLFKEGCYQELIDNFPKSKLLYRALWAEGSEELQKGDTAKAKKLFLKILKSGPETYKHATAETLAEIFLEEGNYKEALNHLDESKKHKDNSFYGCGFARGAEYLHIKEMYAKCYLGLKDFVKADNILIPYLLANNCYESPNIVQLAYKSLLARYSKEDLKKNYSDAFKNYITEKIKDGNAYYNQYSINFVDTKVVLQVVFDHNNPENEIHQIYRKSLLYSFLQN